jgi:hypothetical protein
MARLRQCYQHLEIESGGTLAIKGEATWGSGSRTHTGELDYDAKPSADKMKFGDGTDELDCQVTMQLVGKCWSSATTSIAAAPTCRFQEVYQRGRSA